MTEYMKDSTSRKWLLILAANCSCHNLFILMEFIPSDFSGARNSMLLISIPCVKKKKKKLIDHGGVFFLFFELKSWELNLIVVGLIESICACLFQQSTL